MAFPMKIQGYKQGYLEKSVFSRGASYIHAEVFTFDALRIK